MKTLDKQNELKLELKRRGTVRARMLLAFQREGELSTKELLRFGPGLSSRLHELREDGHRIVATRITGSLYRYTYLGKKQDEDDGSTNVSVID